MGGWQAAVVAGVVVLGSAGPMASAAVAQDDSMRPYQGQRPQTQRGGGRGRAQGDLPAVEPDVRLQELQDVFDAFALVQAQRVLRLNNDEYGRFFPRMSRVYRLRRQHAAQRMRIINEIRRLVGPQNGSDDALAEALKRLETLDLDVAAQLRTARQAVDETLTIRQRAALRFFEEDMERRKIEFLTQARGGGA